MFTIETWLPLLALPLPFIVYSRSKSLHDLEAALSVPFFNTIDSFASSSSANSARSGPFKWLYLYLMWILLLVSCCRPIWIGEPVPIREDARNILLAVDISESMSDRDIAYNNRYVKRIDLVKFRLGEFIVRRSSDRLGLILFADNAYLQSPLTYDNETINQYLQDARVGFAGRNTAIGDAIGLGVKRLEERSDASRILVLLTDGANTAGNVDPLEASRIAAEQGIKIYTIGIYQQASRFANRAAKVLEEIAEMTGGQHFIASNDQQLQTVYKELDRLEPVSQEARLFIPTKAYFHIPLAGFLALGIAGLLARAASNNLLGADSFLSKQNITNNAFGQDKVFSQDDLVSQEKAARQEQ